MFTTYWVLFIEVYSCLYWGINRQSSGLSLQVYLKGASFCSLFILMIWPQSVKKHYAMTLNVSKRLFVIKIHKRTLTTFGTGVKHGYSCSIWVCFASLELNYQLRPLPNKWLNHPLFCISKGSWHHPVTNHFNHILARAKFLGLLQRTFKSCKAVQTKKPFYLSLVCAQ